MQLLLGWILTATIGVAVVLGAIGSAGRRRVRALERRHAERAGEDLASFTAALADLGAPAEDLAVVYALFQRSAHPVAGFPVHPEDELACVYGIAGEDRQNVVLQLLGTCGLRHPTPAEAARFGALERVGDVVEFLRYAREGYPASWGRAAEGPTAAAG